MQAIRAGLVGFGSSARVFHAPVLRAVAGLELAAIVERHADSAHQAYPDVRVVRDLAGLLGDDSIRLIVIATPNLSHHELARQCLLAGRDVVVDKPFTVTSSEARDLVELAGARGRLLSVYQNRRWDGDFLTLRELIGSGTLGRVVRFESRYDRYRARRRPAAWRESEAPGSGILFDLGPHLLDQALALFGMPQAVTADIRLERDDSVVDDAFDILLQYPSLRVALGASMLASAPGPRFLVHGTRGTYSKYGMDPQENALKAGALPESPGWGEEEEARWGTLTLAEDGPAARRAVRTQPGDYRLYYANVRDAMAGAAQLAVTPPQALCVMRLLELARESSRRRVTVDCPLEVLA